MSYHLAKQKADTQYEKELDHWRDNYDFLEEKFRAIFSFSNGFDEISLISNKGTEYVHQAKAKIDGNLFELAKNHDDEVFFRFYSQEDSDKNDEAFEYLTEFLEVIGLNRDESFSPVK